MLILPPGGTGVGKALKIYENFKLPQVLLIPSTVYMNQNLCVKKLSSLYLLIFEQMSLSYN